MAMKADLGDAFLRVRVKVEAPLPGIAEQVKELLPHALDVSLVYETQAKAPSGPARGGLKPAELFADFYRGKQKADPPPALLALFETVLEEVHSPEAEKVLTR